MLENKHKTKQRKKTKAKAAIKFIKGRINNAKVHFSKKPDTTKLLEQWLSTETNLASCFPLPHLPRDI